MGSVAIDKIGI